MTRSVVTASSDVIWTRRNIDSVAAYLINAQAGIHPLVGAVESNVIVIQYTCANILEQVDRGWGRAG